MAAAFGLHTHGQRPFSQGDSDVESCLYRGAPRRAEHSCNC